MSGERERGNLQLTAYRLHTQPCAQPLLDRPRSSIAAAATGSDLQPRQDDAQKPRRRQPRRRKQETASGTTSYRNGSCTRGRYLSDIAKRYGTPCTLSRRLLQGYRSFDTAFEGPITSLILREGQFQHRGLNMLARTAEGSTV